MSPVIIKTVRIKKRILVAIIVLIILSLWLVREQNDKAEKGVVTAMSPVLASRVIVVDPGHGGVEPGVIGKTGVQEKEINLAVSKLLVDNLAQAGAMVLMTRDTDMDLSDPDTIGLAAKKKEDLERRVAIANNNMADLYINIHVNSFPDARRSGARVYYQPGAEQGEKAGRHIQSELAHVLKGTDSHPVGVDYYTTRNTSMAAVVVDVGYISNDTEEKLLRDPAYQGKLAWAIYAGTVKYFAIETPPTQRPSGDERVIQTFKEQEGHVLGEP
ncbi:MAG: cell wall hydrolase [Peptococcaceae bacterium]|nr:cell wall hydrolase [Candidatus Syntrophopropionicum ammoniitolerans]